MRSGIIQKLCLLGTGLGSFVFSTGLCAQTVGTAIGGLEASPTHTSPASVFWNPAVIGVSDKTEMEANLSILGGWLIYDRQDKSTGFRNTYPSTSTEVLAPTPFLSVSSPLGTKHFRFGYATYFPGGGVADYTKGGPQRYELVNGFFVPWNHQFTLAYSPNSKWSFGASAIYSIAFLKANLDIDLAPFISELLGGSVIDNENPSLASATTVNSSTAHSFGFVLGTLYRPSVQWSFGASVHLPMQYDFETTMDINIPRVVRALGAAPIALGLEEKVGSKAKFTFQIPPVVNFGFRYQPFGYWTGDYYGRYAFSSLSRYMSIDFQASPIGSLERTDLIGEKSEDTWVFGTSQSFQLWRPLSLGLVSFFGNTGINSEDMSPSRVGFNQLAVGGFGRYRWKNSLKIGIEYAHYFFFERKIRTAVNPQSGLNVFQKPESNGKYRAGIDRVGVTAFYAF